MAANQSRRRTDLGPLVTNCSDQKPDASSIYADLDKNSIRLLEIHPAKEESDPVICTLSPAPFGEREEFTALSYKWGDDNPDDSITLNEVGFPVRRNLLGALRFLRAHFVSAESRRHRFWIDAICINQANVLERNRQLRIMSLIYRRAATVVVWLGGSYAAFQKKMKELPSDQGKQIKETSDNIERQMVVQLRTDGYWDRLWILQEIGKARRLRVCFGNESQSWEAFMDLMNAHHSDGSKGPLRLDQMRKQRYQGSHTLKSLLENHGHASCSEPRDKVYGLAGLDLDASGFPMDYSKSLFEVWKDTMVHMNGRKLFQKESEILPFGGLVKSLLMENRPNPLSRVAREYEDQRDPTQLIGDEENPSVFCLKSKILGQIVYVDTSANDFISQPDVELSWDNLVQEVYPTCLGEAHRENDKLFEALLRSDESQREKMCFNRRSSVIWEETIPLTGSTHPLVQYTKVTDGSGGRKSSGIIPSSTSETPSPTTIQPHLFLMRNLVSDTSRKMGVASDRAQEGDLVCWIRSSRRALLVRSSDAKRIRLGSHWVFKSKLQVVGSALATDDVCGLDLDYAQRWDNLRGCGGMKVKLDAGTNFISLD